MRSERSAPRRALRALMDSGGAGMDLSGTVIAADRLIVTLTVVQLRALVADAVTEAVERTNSPRGEWMTRQEVAQMVNCKESYVSELVRRRGLPAHQPGGRGSRLRFKRSEIEAWMARDGRR